MEQLIKAQLDLSLNKTKEIEDEAIITKPKQPHKQCKIIT